MMTAECGLTAGQYTPAVLTRNINAKVMTSRDRPAKSVYLNCHDFYRPLNHPGEGRAGGGDGGGGGGGGGGEGGLFLRAAHHIRHHPSSAIPNSTSLPILSSFSLIEFHPSKPSKGMDG